MAITFTINVGGGSNPLTHSSIGSSTSRTLTINSISGDNSNNVSDYSFTWYFIDKPTSTNSTITNDTGLHPDKNVVTVNSIDQWGTYRIFCIARHKETNNRSESNPLKAPESSFFNIRVQGPNFDLEKPAKGQRNWQDQYNTLIQTVSDNMGSGGSSEDFLPKLNPEATGSLEIFDNNTSAGTNNRGIKLYSNLDKNNEHLFVRDVPKLNAFGFVDSALARIGTDVLPTGATIIEAKNGHNLYISGSESESIYIKTKPNVNVITNEFNLFNFDTTTSDTSNSERLGIKQVTVGSTIYNQIRSHTLPLGFVANPEISFDATDSNAKITFGTSGNDSKIIFNNPQVSATAGTHLLTVQTIDNIPKVLKSVQIGSGLSYDTGTATLSATGGSTGDFLPKLNPEVTGSLEVFQSAGDTSEYFKIRQQTALANRMATGTGMTATVLEGLQNNSDDNHLYMLNNEGHIYIRSRHPTDTGFPGMGRIRMLSPYVDITVAKEADDNLTDDNVNNFDFRFTKNSNTGQNFFSSMSDLKISAIGGEINFITPGLGDTSAIKIASLQPVGGNNNTLVPMTIGSGLSYDSVTKTLSATGGSSGDFLPKLNPEATGSLYVFQTGTNLTDTYFKIETESGNTKLGSFKPRSNLSSNITHGSNLSFYGDEFHFRNKASTAYDDDSIIKINSSGGNNLDSFDIMHNQSATNKVPGFKIDKNTGNKYEISVEAAQVSPSSGQPAFGARDNNHLTISSPSDIYYQAGKTSSTNLSYRPVHAFSLTRNHLPDNYDDSILLMGVGGTLDNPDGYQIAGHTPNDKYFALRNLHGPVFVGCDNQGHSLTLYTTDHNDTTGNTELSTPASSNEATKVVITSAQNGEVQFHKPKYSSITDSRHYLNIRGDNIGNVVETIIESNHLFNGNHLNLVVSGSSDYTNKIRLTNLGIIEFYGGTSNPVQYLSFFNSTTGNFPGSVISSPAGQDLILTSAGTNNNIEAILTGKGGAFYISDNNSGNRFDILSLNDIQGFKVHTFGPQHFTGSSFQFSANPSNPLYYFEQFPNGGSDSITQAYIGQGTDGALYRNLSASSFFSGGHIYQCISGSTFEPGDVVSLNNNIIEFPQTNNSKLACGIIARLQEATEENPIPTSLGEEITSGICAKIISVGDNRFMDCEGFKVCNENGSIEAGDLLVTSSRPGYLMKQDDDIIRSKTVGKAMVNVVFDENGLATNIYGFIYCG